MLSAIAKKMRKTHRTNRSTVHERRIEAELHDLYTFRRKKTQRLKSPVTMQIKAMNASKKFHQSSKAFSVQDPPAPLPELVRFCVRSRATNSEAVVVLNMLSSILKNYLIIKVLCK